MTQEESIKGIDKDKVIDLSEKIREAWNDFFLESRYCQNQINFGPEEKTNYMGDLLNYFDDTVELLEHIPLKPNYQLALYDTVSVLQLMYVGQDLIDEVRYVFKMPASNGTDKSLIRTLRNELTGHPISRDKRNNFISSVFFTQDSYGKAIEYLRYHRDRKYESETIRYEWDELIRAHENYLIENLTAILATIQEKLKLYQNQLTKFLNSFSRISFYGLVNKTEHLLESFFENSALYSKPNLLYFFQNYEVHPRYQLSTDLFVTQIKAGLLQTLADIKQFRTDGELEGDLYDTREAEVKIIFTNGKSSSRSVEPVVRNIRYQFSKLRENHPVIGIDHFLQSFKDDPELLAELTHMQDIRNDDREFHCSYEYLRHLFAARGLL